MKRLWSGNSKVSYRSHFKLQSPSLSLEFTFWFRDMSTLALKSHVLSIPLFCPLVLSTRPNDSPLPGTPHSPSYTWVLCSPTTTPHSWPSFPYMMAFSQALKIPAHTHQRLDQLLQLLGIEVRETYALCAADYTPIFAVRTKEAEAAIVTPVALHALEASCRVLERRRTGHEGQRSVGTRMRSLPAGIDGPGTSDHMVGGIKDGG